MAEAPLAAAVVGSPCGPLWLLAGPAGLLRLDMAPTAERQAAWALRALGARTIVEQPEHPTLQQAARQLKAYFAGARAPFDLPLDLRGTPFQLRVWRALLGIPHGATRSYRELAESIGHPQATRAVGAANGANPISIIVPCHRLLGSDGALRGYGGGLAQKRWLIALERGEQHERSSADAR